MSWKYFLESNKGTRHRVFISYYHKEDEYYRNRFEELFGHLFINRSVKPGDINTDLSDEYIKRLIQQGYISSSSVVLVLVGCKTYCRKHVDWEISAGLMKKVGGYSGLLGILLPGFPLTPRNTFYYEDLPPRLADNVKTGYAKIYAWNWVCSDENRIKNAIDEAFKARVEKAHLIDNTRPQFKRNRCE